MVHTTNECTFWPIIQLSGPNKSMSQTPWQGTTTSMPAMVDMLQAFAIGMQTFAAMGNFNTQQVWPPQQPHTNWKQTALLTSSAYL